MPSTYSPAWLFDIYPHPRKSELVVWIRQGDKTYKRQVPYTPAFCVKAETRPLELAERHLALDPRVERTWRDESALWLAGPRQPVLRVQPKRFQDTWRVATDLRRATQSKGFLFFDVDDQPESRWNHERGLFMMCRLKLDQAGLPLLEPADDEERWGIDYPDPHITSIRLSLETEKLGNVPDWDDPLVAIALGDERFACTTPGDPEAEKRALLAFGRRLHDLDPDAIVTRHGDRYDLPYLLRRIRLHRIHHRVRLGRDPDAHPDNPDQRGKSLHTYGRWLYKTDAFYLRGRWHIDLAKKSLDAEDDRKDLHGILYLARTSNRRAQDVNRNGAGYALQQMQIDHARDLGVALPWKRNLAEDWKDAATLCAVDRGGQIMNPQPGLYEDVAACDFSGYYPSLVVRHNLSSDTINCQCCPDGPVIPELGYHVCTKRYGHQAEILRRLWPHRRYVKAMLKRAAHEGIDDVRNQVSS